MEPDSEEDRYLDHIGANANVGGIRVDHILLRPEPRLIEVWEEFLHGTRRKCGLIDDTLSMVTAEIHIKRFMIGYRHLMGISDEDAAILEWMAASYEAHD